VNIHLLDPLSDHRWDELVARHPRGSAFHQRGWLESLSRTYGYKPLVVTSTSAEEPLNDGIVLCCVSSWITGTRLVSLPFADHCDPLLNDAGESLGFVDWLKSECDCRGWKYVELRPRLGTEDLQHQMPGNASYYFHSLDLAPALGQIFQSFHRDSIQRRVRRAEKEGLEYEAGRSDQLIDEFYRLLVMTRRRHHVLPQPRAWFQNLVVCMGEKTQIRLVRKSGKAIAAMLNLRHRSSVVYKYGCSDERFHHLGGMPLLFWRLIEESKATGADEVDFGRSDMDNPGLVTFKDRFGTTKKLLTYFRYPQTQKRVGAPRWDLRAMRQVVAVLPNAILPAAGGLLYRHMG